MLVSNYRYKDRMMYLEEGDYMLVRHINPDDVRIIQKIGGRTHEIILYGDEVSELIEILSSIEQEIKEKELGL